MNPDLLPERFWAKVNKTDTCWLWTASVDRIGYGYYTHNHTSKKAHRVLYETLVGPVPAGLVLDHLCAVKHCVNPDHLEPVTQAENVRRAIGLGDTCTCGSPIVLRQEGERLRKRCTRCGHHGRPPALTTSAA